MHEICIAQSHTVCQNIFSGKAVGSFSSLRKINILVSLGVHETLISESRQNSSKDVTGAGDYEMISATEKCQDGTNSQNVSQKMFNKDANFEADGTSYLDISAPLYGKH